MWFIYLLSASSYASPVAPASQSPTAHKIDLDIIRGAPLPPTDIDITQAYPLADYNLLGNASWVTTEVPSVGLSWIYRVPTK